MWDGVAADLARTHRVHLVQVNGFGGDAPGDNAKPGMLAGIAADLDRYIAEHKIDRPAIIGHSMGGLLAMMMGARYPAATGRVMVVDALPFFSLLFDPAMTVERARPCRTGTCAHAGDAGAIRADHGRSRRHLVQHARWPDQGCELGDKGRARRDGASAL